LRVDVKTITRKEPFKVPDSSFNSSRFRRNFELRPPVRHYRESGNPVQPSLHLVREMPPALTAERFFERKKI
jgi:hypothetical protein